MGRVLLKQYHGLEKEFTGNCCAISYNNEVQRKKWLHDACHSLKHTSGAAKTLLTEMQTKQTEIAISKKISQLIKDQLGSSITYFTNQLHRMNYSTYREQNLPIGSGVTEAACKTLIKERLCKSGAKWKDSGVKTVLALRSLVQTPFRWDQFFTKMIQCGWNDLKIV